ncbi:MAG: 2-amino-4-hydroxy-6-hydroxymethyldihydropteridine diphosphokinase [SAR324 cluster bacterium]|nr:2-amino-4-hydroxy-6-hydroxymethyldihydropteridine diphosphokinase [SAR324 cluster bacterium]
MATVYIGLGSNIAPERNLVAAMEALRMALRPIAVSPVYRTPPWGVTDQADFLNAVLEAETALQPLPLLDTLQAIEASLARQRTRRWGPRSIDLDILLYGDLLLESERLTLPHARLHERGFILKPLCDLNPGLLHPVLRKDMAQLWAETDQTGIIVTDLDLCPEGMCGGAKTALPYVN